MFDRDAQVLLDRLSETELLGQLLLAIQRGQSRALVLRGEPGVGKSALLGHLARVATGCRVVSMAGVQAERELAFAGLHQVCSPLLDRLPLLPGPQQAALSTAFGLARGPAPDRFLVGLAALGLLAEAAREHPLVCLVDDAQWLDGASAQSLGFVGRRLVAESVGLVFAARDFPEPESESLAGLAELRVGGLPQKEARRLLGTAWPGPVDAQVVDRTLAEARGNPLALLELPRGFSPAELAGGFRLAEAGTLPTRIEESFRRQIAPLPVDTRRLLLVAAADPVGDPVLLWGAAGRLGIGSDAAAPASEAGLLDFGDWVRFRHPLLRSAIYRAASPAERRSVHRALAQATDREADPDRRAWHGAQAADGPDGDVAADLEHSAGRAQARGGLAAAAAFLERSAELSTGRDHRARRLVAAAQAAHLAGAPRQAVRLLSLAEACPLTPLQRARVDLQRAEIAFTLNRGREAPSLLLRAARQLERLDAGLAAETYLDALLAAMFAGALTSGVSVHEAALAARAMPIPSEHPRAPELLLQALAGRFLDGYAAAAPVLRRALRAFRDDDLSAEEGLRWLWHACITAAHLWDHDTWELLATRFVRLARDAGALAVLPLALSQRISVHVLFGELTEAASLREELESVTEATGDPPPPIAILLLAAWQGRLTEAMERIEATSAEAERRGEGDALVKARWTAALLYNSLGQYEDALVAAEQASAQPPVLGVAPWAALSELVEAAAGSARPARAAAALQQLAEITRASGTDWALGIEARCRALLSRGEAAEPAYREAIDRLARTRIRGELARAHLAYGRWLRLEDRPTDAREQLRTAHDLFTRMGMEAFARRAGEELSAAGETVPTHATGATGALTAQEAQISRLVGDGLSNADVAARLLLSPRTVEWHLSNIYTKLGITSRKELRS
jgi:DNA-binding CsgD family transcriptional regulator/tetratricopeptide (TPR) repeat protein